MSGRQMEHLLTLIDESILRGRESMRGEIFSYMLNHEGEVLDSLRFRSKVTVPTSSGPVEINLAELEALVA